MPGINQKKPLRVLHIGKYFPPHPGGMETYLRDLMRVQHRNGIEVTALVHSSQPTVLDKDIQVNALNDTKFRVRFAARWFNLSFIPVSPLFIFTAAKTIREFKPDVIHLHLPNASAAWLLLLASARKKKWITTWHSDIETDSSSLLVRLAYWFYKPIEKQQISKSQKIIVTSPPYLAHSKPLLNWSKKCEVIPLALDQARMPKKHKRDLFDLRQNATILFVGRFAPYKNLSSLIEALNLLPSIRLWLVGDGEDRVTLEQLASNLGLTDRVTFFGSVKDSQLWELYKKSNIFCLPSSNRNEAFGMVLLEAAYFDLRLVVPNLGGSGVPWVANKLGNCQVASGSNPASLAAAISNSLKAPANECNNLPFDLKSQMRSIQRLYQEPC